MRPAAFSILVCALSVAACTPFGAAEGESVGEEEEAPAPAGTPDLPSPPPRGQSPARPSEARTISFVQMAADDFDETASANVVLPSPSRAGDLIVLAIGWFDKTSSVTGVVDSAGNEYKQVSAPTRLDSDDGPVTQQLFFAAGVVAGAREITVSWDVDATNPDIRVAEFQGLDTAQPLATSSVNKTDALSVVSKPLTTGGPSLLFAGMTTQGSTVQGDPAAVSPLITKQKNLAQWVIVDRGSHSLKATQQIEIGDGFAVEAITEVAAFR